MCYIHSHNEIDSILFLIVGIEHDTGVLNLNQIINKQTTAIHFEFDHHRLALIILPYNEHDISLS